jgi:hypothetical protein
MTPDEARVVILESRAKINRALNAPPPIPSKFVNAEPSLLVYVATELQRVADLIEIMAGD